MLACILLPATAGAQPPAGSESVLPEQPLIPVLRQHDKPEPYPILPLFDLGSAPGQMPYRVDKMRPGPGVLAPLMSAQTPIKLGAGYGGAGDAKETFGQATYRGADGAVSATGVAATAGGYDDGRGQRVRFGYDRETEQLKLDYRPRSGSALNASFIHDRIDDNVLPLAAPTNEHGVALSEGFGSDPVKTERVLASIAAEQADPFDGLDRLKLEIRYAGLERMADNFDLRTSPSASRNEARPTRQVLGLGVSGDEEWSDALASRLTLSGQSIWHDATRLGGPNTPLTTISGYQYPGVEMWEASANLDTVWRPAAASRLGLGVRYDFAGAEAEKLDDVMRIGSGATAYAGTPRTLYELYCGPGCAERRQDHMLSAKLDGRQELLGDRLALNGSVGRIMRAADTQERYFALPSATGAAATGTSARQVGNPSLASEQHYRAELGLAATGAEWTGFAAPSPTSEEGLREKAWRVSASAYADHVLDFISRDRAHGQDGVAANDNAFIWRNVDAELAGLDLEAAWNLTGHWASKAVLSWRWGENVTDGRALYGIDPLELDWLVQYQDTIEAVGVWDAGFKVRAVAGQGRRDADASTGSSFDAPRTGGFGLVDLFLGMRIRDAVGVRIGIDNLFGKAYAESNPYNVTDDANPSAVYGPGRTVYLRVVGTF